MLKQSSLFGLDVDGNARPTCPHCGSLRAASNGRVKAGARQYICSHCLKRYQDRYVPSATTPTTKRCPRCKQWLPLGVFKKREPFNAASEKRQPYCDPCQSAYHHEHYVRNKPAYLAQASTRNRTIRRQFYERLWEYLHDHPCVDCGEPDPVVLEFDHRDDVLKINEISRMATLRWAAVESEIAKCDVRCANCHRRRTAAQFGWYRELLGVAQSGERLPSKQDVASSTLVVQSKPS